MTSGEARLAFLLRLADRLRHLDDPEAIQHEAARQLGEHLGASRVGYAEILPDGETSVVTHNYTDGVRDIEGRYRVADYSPTLLDALRAGRTVARDDVHASPDLTDAERAAHAALEVGATVDLPLVRGGRLVAVLFMHHRGPHAWTADELTLLADVGARTWDAVERARAESALRASEAQFRALVRATSDLLYRMSPDWSEMRELWGGRHHVEGDRPRRDWLDTYILPEDQPRVREVIARAIRDRRVVEFEHRVRRADGGVAWKASRAVPLLDAAGALVGWFGVASEVTARKQAEAERERLLEAERRARAAAEAARERTARLQSLTAALSTASTLAEVVDAVVTHVSAAFGATGTVIACLAPDGEHLEILGAADMPGDLRDAWRRFPLAAPTPLADVARAGEPLFLESRADWEARYPHLLPALEAAGHRANAVAPLVADGRVIGVLGAAFAAPRAFDAEDRAQVTAVAQQCALALERARLFEAERVARHEAESANRAKSEFLAVMSHELRTPLNAIAGYTELIELGLRGPVTAQQRADLARIQASQRHLLGLINQVLDYTRVGAGAVRYDVADVPVAEALAAAEALVIPQARARRLTCVRESCPPRLTVHGDREKLQQVLLNLLSNAIKFTEPGGEIRVRCEARGDTIAIVVVDTGIGIAADKILSIFEPFVQVDQRLTRPHDGVGLGLAISRELARGMGGDLQADSVSGLGSTFTLTVPRGRDEP